MILIYVIVGLLVIGISLAMTVWVYMFKASRYKDELEASSLKSETAIVTQTSNRDAAIAELKTKQQTEQTSDEVKISEGDREELNDTNF